MVVSLTFLVGRGVDRGESSDSFTAIVFSPQALPQGLPRGIPGAFRGKLLTADNLDLRVTPGDEVPQSN